MGEREVHAEILAATIEALQSVHLEQGRVDKDSLGILFRAGAALAEQRANPAAVVHLAASGFDYKAQFSADQLSAFRAVLLEGYVTRTAERLDQGACSFALRNTRMIVLDATTRLLAVPEHIPLSWLAAFEGWLDELEEHWMHHPVASLHVILHDALDPIFTDRVLDSLRAISALGTHVTLVPGGARVRAHCQRIGFDVIFAKTVLTQKTLWQRLFAA